MQPAPKRLAAQFLYAHRNSKIYKNEKYLIPSQLLALSGNYLFSQFVYPLGGDGVKRVNWGYRYFSPLQVPLYMKTGNSGVTSK